MKSDLWIVFAVTAGFLGFQMGYALPPMQEVGLSAFGHGDKHVEESAEADAAMEQFKELENLMK
ncbi:MAG: hypothetical protein OEN52_00490 [Gammaproteobacteria bacterium]|nr:hypothetical protein [Gammaproteobacteria bacterium]MDH3559419.1 hypothetical protein [Gammaproteobacteria bacterium]